MCWPVEDTLAPAFFAVNVIGTPSSQRNQLDRYGLRVSIQVRSRDAGFIMFEGAPPISNGSPSSSDRTVSASRSPATHSPVQGFPATALSKAKSALPQYTPDYKSFKENF